MKKDKTYTISFKELEDGEHLFTFPIRKDFFSEFKFSEINEGNLNVQIDLQKKPSLLIFLFQIHGSVNVMCDRCLEYFDLPVHVNTALYVKIGDAFTEETDDMVVIPESETGFDVSHYLYEYIHLSIPIRRVHPENKKGESGCNQSMIRFIEELTGRDGQTKESGLKELEQLIKLN